MIGFIFTFDLAVEQALYAVRSPQLVQTFIWISELARMPTILGFTAVAVILLVYRKRLPPAIGLLASVLGSVATVTILKEIVARPRPSSHIAAYLETTSSLSSFPSSHATLAVAFYGFLLCVMWGVLSPVQKWIKAGAVGIIVLAVGFSRLYLGVHYPSDVLAGYLLGGIFLAVGVAVTKKLSRAINSAEMKDGALLSIFARAKHPLEDRHSD